MSSKINLTPELLKKIIAEEKQKLIDLGLLKEDNLAITYKKLTLQEAKLREKLSKVQTLKSKLKKKIDKRS